MKCKFCEKHPNKKGLPHGGGAGDVQQPPQQQENSRMIRTIQIQLLLSKTLHRQLFIVCLLKMK